MVRAAYCPFLHGHRSHARAAASMLVLERARSPITKTSGWPGMVRSGSTITRPARSSGQPSTRPSGEAATPAAHKMTAAGTVSPM